MCEGVGIFASMNLLVSVNTSLCCIVVSLVRQACRNYFLTGGQTVADYPLATSSATSEIRPAVLYDDTLPLVGL